MAQCGRPLVGSERAPQDETGQPQAYTHWCSGKISHGWLIFYLAEACAPRPANDLAPEAFTDALTSWKVENRTLTLVFAEALPTKVDSEALLSLRVALEFESLVITQFGPADDIIVHLDPFPTVRFRAAYLTDGPKFIEVQPGDSKCFYDGMLTKEVYFRLLIATPEQIATTVSVLIPGMSEWVSTQIADCRLLNNIMQYYWTYRKQPCGEERP